MARVLLVGYDPETVDYSNPAYPPGMTAEIISAGIALTLTQMTDRGWDSDVCYIRPDKAAGQTVDRVAKIAVMHNAAQTARMCSVESGQGNDTALRNRTRTS